MPFDLGSVVPLGTTVRDSTGALANAGAMTLTITLPDSTTTTVSPVTPVSTGTYAYDYTTTLAGRHAVRWTATGVNAGAYTDMFDVRQADPHAILSLTDAKAHLDIESSSHDDELRGWVETTTACVEHFVGPVVVRTVAEVHEGSRLRVLALRRIPVLAVSSVTAVLTSGVSYTPDLLDVDQESGVVRLLNGGTLCGPLRVTYTAGRTVIPASVRDAAKIILQHLWRTQYGASRALGSIGGGDDMSVTEPIPGLGYAIPNRALQLLEPYRLPPGVA